jgi:hypothetical protein
MPYSIQKSDPIKPAFAIEVLTTDTTSTSIALTGRSVKNYGEQQQTDFVRMLENFASPVAPLHPIEGQFWFNNDSSTLVNPHQVLNVYTQNAWKPLYVVDGGALVPSIQPTNPQAGQLWFDLSTKDMKYFDNISGTWIPVIKPRTPWKVGLVF